MVLTLRPYQVQCLQAMERAEAAGQTRQLLVLSTGLGKTVIVAAALKARGVPKTFAFMHRDELIKQAADKILAMTTDEARYGLLAAQHAPRIGIEKADSFSDPMMDQIILASVQTVGRTDRKRLTRFPENWPRIVWVDESHHAPAASFLEVLDHFGIYGEKPKRADCLLWGTTATPDRLDKLGYDKIFDDVVFRYGLREGIRDGWLADIRALKIGTNVDLSSVKIRQGDFAQDQLAEAVNTPERNALAARIWADRCRGERSLFFCVDKAHAHAVRETLTAMGAKAMCITDDTPADERAYAVQAFRAGTVEALTNVGIFGEGYDEPLIKHVHMLRPTKSRMLFTQGIGRGTRRVPGVKDFVNVYDYADQAHDICSIGRIFGLPDSWDLDGQSVEADAEKLEEIESELPIANRDGLKSIADLARRIAVRADKMKLIRESVLTDAGLPSDLCWLKPSPGEDRYVIAWRNEDRDKIERLPDRIRALAVEIIDKYDLWGVYERVEIFTNELGIHEAVLFDSLRGMRSSRKLDSDRSLAKLLGRLDKWVDRERPHKINLLRKNVRWASEPASEKQVQALQGKGVPQDVLKGWGLTKREASILMSMPRERISTLFKG